MPQEAQPAREFQDGPGGLTDLTQQKNLDSLSKNAGGDVGVKGNKMKHKIET